MPSIASGRWHILNKYLLNECVSDWKITLSLDPQCQLKYIFLFTMQSIFSKTKHPTKTKNKKAKLFSNCRTIRHSKTQLNKGLRLLLDNILQITYILLRIALCWHCCDYHIIYKEGKYLIIMICPLAQKHAKQALLHMTTTSARSIKDVSVMLWT